MGKTIFRLVDSCIHLIISHIEVGFALLSSIENF